VSLSPEDAFAAIPPTLRDDLLGAFNEIVKNYREHRWEPSELNGGKLCEAVYTIIVGWLEGGTYPKRSKKPAQFPQQCWGLEAKYQTVPDSRSARVLIPRMMLGVLDIRNDRNVGHTGGDVDPNPMDAMAVLHNAKWLVAELVRLLHTLTIEEATAIVDALTEREVPLVWAHGDKKRVLRPGLTLKKQTLLLLLSEADEAPESDLLRWLEHKVPATFRKDVLLPMHKARWIEYDKVAATVRLLPPGVIEAEAVVHAK
jgi:hypothetical protein